MNVQALAIVEIRVLKEDHVASTMELKQNKTKQNKTAPDACEKQKTPAYKTGVGTGKQASSSLTSNLCPSHMTK